MTKVTQNLIKELDKSNVYGSVLSFTDQVRDGWIQSEKISLPPTFGQIRNIVVAAMGGSALGAQFVSSVFSESLKLPFEIINDYQLPGYVDDQTLVIADSYSGNTEETLSAYEQAKKRQAKIFVISSGGQLEKKALADNIPHFTINPVYNPSNQPRMALGYPIGSIVELSSKLNLINLKIEEVEGACRLVREKAEKFKIENGGDQALATAESLLGKIPVLIASEHLLGAAHATGNQLNENSKTFAIRFPIPELNHHLMEGLQFPSSNQEDRFFVFYESSLYHSRNQKRYQITQQLLEEHKIPYSSFVPEGSKLEQALEVVQFGGFVNFYLALLNGVDPAPIPTVDWFKKEMGRKIRISKFERNPK